MLMQFARRGGHLAGKKIQPKNAVGHVQALRLQIFPKDLGAPQPRWWKKKDKAGGSATWKQCASKPIVSQTTILAPIRHRVMHLCYMFKGEMRRMAVRNR